MPFIVETGGRITAAGLQFLSRILPLEAEGTAGLTRRHERAALRGSRATCLHRLPRRYTRLIVLLKIRGRGATWVSKSMMIADDDPTDTIVLVLQYSSTIILSQ